MKHSMSKPDEIYAINPKTGAETELSFRINQFWIN